MYSFCWLSGLILFVAFASLTGCQQSPADNGSNIADHSIECRYDPATRQIDGVVTFTWKNATRRTAEVLQFHTYMNAFSNAQSTYWQEAGEAPQAILEHPGHIIIHNVVDQTGRELTAGLHFVRPEDNNPHDSTLAQVKLSQPVAPGESVKLDITFSTVLPPLVERTGFLDSYVIAAQWFPKMAVFSDSGWIGHQYHYNSEYFADFGAYNLKLTLPDSFVVAACGSLLDQQTADGLTTWHFAAAPVHDMAWVADPSFQVIEEQVDEIQIKLFVLPEHQGAVASRVLNAVTRGLQFFSANVGQYAYKNLTCVESPVFSAVMEYPTLFLTGNFDGYKNPPAPLEAQPENNRFPERLTLHELGHQWFYGMSANNEGREAWLDEGLTDFITAKAFEELFGPIMQPGENSGEIRVRDFRRDRFVERPRVAIAQAAWQYPDFGSYYIGSYVKPKLMLHTMDEVLGENKMQKVVANFFAAARFRHPTTEDFLSDLRPVAGPEMLAFAKACLYDTTTVDFYPAGTDGERIRIVRSGNLSCPVEILLVFADESSERIYWSGNSPDIWISDSGKREVKTVIVDPDGKVEIELDKSNNRLAL